MTETTDLNDDSKGIGDRAIELERTARAFLFWVTHNEFTDPENMLVCAEWSNLCGALGEPMQMAGSALKELPNGIATA